MRITWPDGNGSLGQAERQELRGDRGEGKTLKSKNVFKHSQPEVLTTTACEQHSMHEETGKERTELTAPSEPIYTGLSKTHAHLLNILDWPSKKH